MGTRGLTAVFLDGEYKVAQYGQWDHYPKGQGLDILEFLQTLGFTKQEDLFNTDSSKVLRFKERVRACRWVTDAEINQTYEECAELEKASKATCTGIRAHSFFKDRLPCVDRDHGGKILEIINNTKEGFCLLQNSINFTKDSLFCEWAYVIDLDKGTFEIFKGFQRNPIAETERFYGPINNKYYPVALVKAYKLDDLPTEEKFVLDCDPEEDCD